MGGSVFWATALGGGVIAALVGVEVILRAWLSHPRNCFVWNPGRRVVFHHDTSILSSASPTARIEINALGERGAPPPRDWRGVFRALTMGASTTECIALDQDSTWPEVMRRKLSTPACLDALGVDSVHVGNIGKSLLPTSAQIEIITALESRYQNLDLLVLMVGASDVIAWLEEGAPAGRGAAPLKTHKIFDRSAANLGWRPRRLACYRGLAILYNAIGCRFRHLYSYTARIAARRLRRQQARNIITEIPDDAGMLTQLEQNLRTLLKHGQKIAHRVVLVRHPWLDVKHCPEIENKMWLGALGSHVDSPEPGDYLSADALARLLERMDAVCARVATEMKVETLATGPLIPTDLDHYVDCIHLGEKGAAIVGDAVADVVCGARRG